MNPILGIFTLTLVVIIVIGGLLGIAHLISKFSLKTFHSKDKDLPYECGVIGQPARTSRISSGFYLVAMLFVLFDIEIIFLYPWALAYRDFIAEGAGLYYLISLMIFLAIFILGLIWEIRIKALDWR